MDLYAAAKLLQVAAAKIAHFPQGACQLHGIQLRLRQPQTGSVDGVAAQAAQVLQFLPRRIEQLAHFLQGLAAGCVGGAVLQHLQRVFQQIKREGHTPLQPAAQGEKGILFVLRLHKHRPP